MVDRITTPVLILEDDGDHAVRRIRESNFSCRRAGWGKNSTMELQRRSAWTSQAFDAEGLHGADAAAFRPRFERSAGDGSGWRRGISYIDREQEKAKTDAIYNATGADGKLK
jgi:hypothetical protein